ncbi:MAG: hypothetical protein LC775_10640 [Acidobacteria bacterium]|nr:hypothetical protein [Acidobacteriota bacterium]
MLFVGDTDEMRETKNAAPVTGEFDQSRCLIGSLVLTVVSIAAPEVARPVRYLSVPLGAVWMAALFNVWCKHGYDRRMVLGAALVVLGMRRGPIRARYGQLDSLDASSRFHGQDWTMSSLSR